MVGEQAASVGAVPRIEILSTPARVAPEELDAARQVQARLLECSAPRLRTLDYGGCYVPARGVGGDFFDVVELAPGRLGLAVGDVSGKGLSAALMMASLQASLRSQYLRENLDLAQVLANVNQVFYESTAAHHYATLFLGDYEDATRRLRYVNCGHPPPIVVRGDDRCERLAATATVLGLFPAWRAAVSEVALEPGDTLLIASDGVTEAMSADDEEFGESRLIEALRGLRHLPVAGMVRELVEMVREYSGFQQWDDLTLLAARPV